MAEPEDVILEAAHVATVAARNLWSRPSGADPTPRLSDLRRRLDLFVAMFFPDAPEISPAEPPAPLSFLARLAAATPAHARMPGPLASTDGSRIRLPRELGNLVADAALSTFQLLALEQAARAERGTPAWLPSADPLVRDLYLLAEAATVDRRLAELGPVLERMLCTARARARATRPRGSLTARELEVERLTRALLDAPPGATEAIPETVTPAGSLEWARAEAARIRRIPGRYRGIAPVEVWGSVAPAPDATPGSGSGGPHTGPRAGARFHLMRRRPRVREPGENEDDERAGTFIVRADDPKESVEDPHGLQRPADRDQDADPGDLGDSLSDLPEARLVRTPDPAHEILASDEPPPRVVRPDAGVTWAGGIAYPEWDWRQGRYRSQGAVVREVPVAVADASSGDRALSLNAALVRKVRRDFERLRPRRQMLRAQPDGAEVDLDAWVVAAADSRAGGAPDGRLYLDERRARRDAAVLLLVDVSASTDGWVAGNRRVIDVEKEGLLIVAEALDALGDPFAVMAFRSNGPERVEVLPVKPFACPPGGSVARRIAALAPDGYTRVGAAVRHATAVLANQPSRHRLLVLLSDGRPNDVDQYEGRYGLEDTRQAFVEARIQGIHPFCLTVDREAPRYAPYVFGTGGYAALRSADHLPQTLLTVVRRLLRS